jgi:SNF2 family DNA or RNA helicase
LTGTPIQNCLDDYGALLSFIRVPPFETQTKFYSYIADPIKKRKDYAFTRLRALVRATCLRRTKQSIGEALELPKKEEVNVVLDLNPADRALYDFFKIQAATAIRNLQTPATPQRPGRLKSTGGGGWLGRILPLISHLRLICDHGEDLLSETALRAWRERSGDSVDWRSVTAGLQKCDSCGVEPKEDDGIAFPVELSCGHIICTSCCADDDTSDSSSTQTPCTRCSRISPIPSQAGISKDYHPSIKIEALLQNLASEGSTLSAEGEGKSSCKRYGFSRNPAQAFAFSPSSSEADTGSKRCIQLLD